MTNFEKLKTKIQNMGDFEFAEFLNSPKLCDYCQANTINCGAYDCTLNILSWLRQEVSE